MRTAHYPNGKYWLFGRPDLETATPVHQLHANHESLYVGVSLKAVVTGASTRRSTIVHCLYRR